MSDFYGQGVPRPIIVSSTKSRKKVEHSYSSVNAFTKDRLKNTNLRRSVTRVCDAGGGVVRGWVVRWDTRFA